MNIVLRNFVSNQFLTNKNNMNIVLRNFVSNQFLTNKSSLCLTAHIVPLIVGPDPDAVLVVVPIVWCVEVPVCETRRCPVHPGECALIQEVCEPDVRSIWVCQGGQGILLCLVFYGGKGS